MAPRRRSEKRLLFRRFLDGRINRGQGRSPGGVGPTQEGVWLGQGLGRAMHPSGCPLAALWPPFGTVEASGTLTFNIIFGIFPAYLNIQKPAQKKTVLVALLKTASVRVSFVQIMQE